ncbi:MAG: arylsulfatase, partial [Bacteroidota bacterium]
SLFEAGTRVPFISYWKGKIEPKVSDAMVSQVDFLASIGKLVGSKVQGKDSQDLLPALMGQSPEGRENLVIQATGRTALRQGDWVLIPPYEGSPISRNVNIETGNDSVYQLYNLKTDLGQQQNLAESESEKLEEMKKLYQAIKGSGD